MDDLGVKPHYFRKHPIWIWGGKFPTKKSKKKKHLKYVRRVLGGRLFPGKKKDLLGGDQPTGDGWRSL